MSRPAHALAQIPPGPMPARRFSHTLTRLEDPSGFTLVEMLISMVIFLALVAALMTALVMTQRTQIRDANYGAAQQQALAGLNSMVSQIRQATSILSNSPNSVELNVNLNGTTYQVLYECDVLQPGTSYRECVRVQSAVGGTLPSLSAGAVVIDNLINGTVAHPVFTFTRTDPVAPIYMTAEIEVPSSNGQAIGLTHAIWLKVGALMRNLDLAS